MYIFIVMYIKNIYVFYLFLNDFFIMIFLIIKDNMNNNLFCFLFCVIWCCINDVINL